SGLPLVMNYYDEHGVEEALRIKERLGGTVTLLTAGPARAALALRSGLAMGADAAVHIEDPALEGADHVGVAKALAAAISVQRYDLILAGRLATDDTAATVGPAPARVEVLELSPPPQRRAGRILQGEPAEMVKELVRFLHEEAKVL